MARTIDRTVADQQVAGTEAFATAGDAAVPRSFLHEDVLAGTVGFQFRSIGIFATLQADGIVVHSDAASLDKYVTGGIEVDTIGAGRSDGMIGTEIADVQDLDVVALVKVTGPEGRVLQGDTRDGDVFREFGIKQARTLLVLVRTLRVPLATQTEVAPIGRTIAIHRAFSAERKAIGALHVNQGGEVLAPFALYARHLDGEVIDVLAAQKDGSTR